MKNLSFCKLCNNRKNSIDKGVVCSLNNKVGSFSEECDFYVLDNEELISKRKKLKNLIIERFPEFNEYNKSGNDVSFEKVVIFENKIYFIFGIVFSILLTFGFIYKAHNNETIYPLIIFSLSLFGISLYKLLTVKKKPIIEISQTEFIYKEEVFGWNDILMLGIGKKENNEETFIVLGTSTRNIVEINTNEFNYPAYKLIQLIGKLKKP